MNLMFQDFIKYLESNGRDQKTIDSYILNIELLLRYLEEYKEMKITTLEEFELILTQDIEDYKSYLQHKPSRRNPDGNKPATINLKLTAVRQLYKFLNNKNIVDNNPMEEIKGLTIPEEEAEYLTVDEAFKLIQTVENGYGKVDRNQLRDTLIIKMFLYCGLRLNELATLKVSDVQGKDSIKITGKRQRVRYPHLNDDIHKSFNDYMEYREQHGIDNEILFVKSTGKIMTNEAIGEVVIKYARLSGVDKKIHAHSLRHAYASITAKTVNALELMRLMGHKKITTTDRYYHMDSERSKEIAKENPLLKKIQGL